VHLDSFDDFFEKAATLYRADPSRIRYVTKYRHCDGCVVLKVTDDVTCLSFRSKENLVLKHMERLNSLFFSS